MALKNTNPTHTNSWSKLNKHYKEIKDVQMMSWFNEDANRANSLKIEWEDFYVDFSKHRITSETLQLLNALASEMDLKDAIKKYFSGDIINETEGRAVLHTALRASENSQAKVEGKNVNPEVAQVKTKIKQFSEGIIHGDNLGYTGKPFTDVVNIGIGGSDLGPAMVVDTLKYYRNHLNTHFVSNVDGDHVAEILKELNPDTTLFIVVSKSFTTQETISNATTIREWFLKSASIDDVAKHFVAVSTNIDKVKEFGIAEDNIFPMWNWVGGRFSLWSAVGLSISLALGYKNFEGLLQGANKMDAHFKHTDFNTNIPVVLALLSIWYNNFFHCETEAIIGYSQYLNQFATYLQQAVMESNGKCVDRGGQKVGYQTGNVVWGEPGTNSQHAFFQLLHQGTKLIPSEFIGFKQSLHDNKAHHDKLMANFFAQTEALMIGKSKEDVIEELKREQYTADQIKQLLPFKIFMGNKPTTTILIDKLTPNSLGKLIALYEHKIFVQGVIWNIFSYDQFGVELGKQLAGNILEELNSSKTSEHDESTQQLIAHYKRES